MANEDDAYDNTAIVVTNIIIWIFSNTVLVPIESYYCYQIYTHADSHVVAKRKPGILLISVITSMIFYFLFQTILLSLSSLKLSVLEDINVIIYYIILPLWYISWFTFIVRLWLLYYTIRHSIETINNQWQEVISKHSKETNYYIQYKHQLGTWSGLRNKIIIYALCTYINDVVMGALLLEYDDNAAKFALYATLGVIKAFTSTLIPIGFLIYMAWQLHKLTFHDNIGLGRELKFCTAGYILILVIRLVDYSISAAVDRADNVEEIISFIVAIEFLLWKLVGFTINLLQTRYPLKRFAAVMKRYSTRQIGKLTHATTLKNVESSGQAQSNEALKMKEVLNNEKSFDLFMAHCGSEHCTECVLSMLEFVQFKQEVYKALSKDGRSDLVSNDDDIRLQQDAFILPQNCPQSDIVFVQSKTFKQMAYALYEKYIAVGCDWEINLDYFTRRKYSRLFIDEEKWESNEEYDDDVKLYEIFDKCLLEMTNLVRAAFSRFKQTDSFMILQNKTKSIKKTSSNYESVDSPNSHDQ